MAALRPQAAAIVGLLLLAAPGTEAHAAAAAAGQGAASSGDAASAKRAARLPQPRRPDALSVSSEQIDLYWGDGDTPEDRRHYRLYRNGALIARVQGAFYSDTGLAPMAAYAYAVEAVGRSGATSARSELAIAATLSGSQRRAFALAVLPDTQKYSRSWPETFLAQTGWIRSQKVGRNIAYVLHEGDIVNGNADEEWERAVEALGRLDGIVPYALVPGNHDMGPGGLPVNRDTTKLNRSFPVERFESWPTFAGVFEAGRIENSHHLFRAGGLDWLVLALEYGPRREVLAWANEIVGRFPERRVIVLTHAYLAEDGRPLGSGVEHKDNPGKGALSKLPGGASSGETIWNELVRRHPNIFLVFSGHVQVDGARSVGVGDAGNPVYQMQANYQQRLEGGSGYLRMVEIDPDASEIRVWTYSPTLDQNLLGDANRFKWTGVDFSREAFEGYRAAHQALRTSRTAEEVRSPSP